MGDSVSGRGVEDILLLSPVPDDDFNVSTLGVGVGDFKIFSTLGVEVVGFKSFCTLGVEVVDLKAFSRQGVGVVDFKTFWV